MYRIYQFILLLLTLGASFSVQGQQLYFPPRAFTQPWETVAPAQLNWNQVALDSVVAYVGRTHGKSLVILHDGRIAVERYYGTFTRDSLHGWNSAGKTLTAVLVGIAQQEGRLRLSDSTSRFLGRGWTALPSALERQITIRHQLTMTTGLNDSLTANGQPVSDNCTAPACLTYLAPPGTRWAYHNAPYRLVQDVVAAAVGTTFQQYTTSRLWTTAGITGLWSDYIFYSRARDMARFGLLLLNRGTWASTPVLTDTAYFRAMTTRSQGLNHAYGYLTWLNGQDSYMIPQVQFVFPGALVPTAPADLYAALGKDDQKIYVAPSLRLVVVRTGDAASTRVLGPSSFDHELWTRLMRVFSQPTGLSEITVAAAGWWPNPATETVHLVESEAAIAQLFDAAGRLVRAATVREGEFSIRGLPAGLYLVRLRDVAGRPLGRRRLAIAAN